MVPTARDRPEEVRNLDLNRQLRPFIHPTLTLSDA
jgi:hypothetical protein